LVELATGMLTVFSIQYLVFRGSSLLDTIYYISLTYALIAIFVSDWRYGIIPDKIVFPAMVLVILFHLRGVPRQLAGNNHLGGVLLTALGAISFFLFLVLITRGQGMGMGDVKFAALMGLVLGWPQLAVALYLAFLTGAIVSVILILLGKKKFGQVISFGPFLTAGTFIALLWGERIWEQISAALL